MLNFNIHYLSPSINCQGINIVMEFPAQGISTGKSLEETMQKKTAQTVNFIHPFKKHLLYIRFMSTCFRYTDKLFALSLYSRGGKNKWDNSTLLNFIKKIQKGKGRVLTEGKSVIYIVHQGRLLWNINAHLKMSEELPRLWE